MLAACQNLDSMGERVVIGGMMVYGMPRLCLLYDRFFPQSEAHSGEFLVRNGDLLSYKSSCVARIKDDLEKKGHLW